MVHPCFIMSNEFSSSMISDLESLKKDMMAVMSEMVALKGATETMKSDMLAVTSSMKELQRDMRMSLTHFKDKQPSKLPAEQKCESFQVLASNP
jgi:hypothetical protein